MDNLTRRKEIIRELEKEGAVKTAELSERFDVTSMTIRRDLNYLAEEGILTVTHGGAVLNKGSLLEHGMFYKEEQYVEEKKRIGEFCFNLVHEGDAIFIDTGTTAKAVAETIVNKKNILVVTHSLPVMECLSDSPGIKLIAAPGVFRGKSMGFLGQMTCDFVSGLHYDTLFLGVEALDVEHGASVPDIIDAETKRALVRNAKKVVVVADYSKIGISYFMSITSLKDIDVLVTNREADEAVIAAVREQGVEVFLV